MAAQAIFSVRGLLVALALCCVATAADAKTRAYVFNDGSGDISIIDTEAPDDGPSILPSPAESPIPEIQGLALVD